MERTASNVSASVRVNTGQKLLEWARSQGGDTSAVSVATSPTYGGLGLFAVKDIPAGAVAFRCPCSCVITADIAVADPTIGSPLVQVVSDKHWRIILFLLHARREGAASPWAPYVSSLPGSELVDLIPAHWSHLELEQLLKGTPLLGQAREGAASLVTFNADVVQAQLCRKWPHVFPSEAYTLAALSWAHAVYWSRAILLPLPGGHGRQPCLVPLLDMANHDPTTTSAVTCERRHDARGADTTLESAPGAVTGIDYVLRVGSRSAANGEELHINYGAKGNGELLRCHGFAVPGNLADVHEIDLAAVDWLGTGCSVEVGTSGTRLDMLEKRGLRRHFLFGGSQLPPGLLPALRVLCAESGSELSRAKSDLDDGEEEADGKGGEFDWSLVDWMADDPFEKANAAVVAHAPAGVACETRALDSLETLLNARLAAMGEAQRENRGSVTLSPNTRTEPSLGETRRQMAAHYVSGQRALLRDALVVVSNLRAKVAEKDTNDSKRPRNS